MPRSLSSLSGDPTSRAGRRAAGPRGRPAGRPPTAAMLLLVPLLAGGCAAGEGELPQPRPLVIHSGERIAPEPERLEEIDAWVRDQMQNIREDPSFLIVTQPAPEEVYPWETLEIEADTARVALERGAADASGPYMIYAHLHLMHEMGRIEEFAPEAEGLTAYDLERAILARVADAWLLGRAVYDLAPYRPLDELLYAQENGFLDAYVLTARAEAFPERREEWLAENPGRQEAFESWFQDAFDMEPPGPRGDGEEEEEETPGASRRR